MTKGDLVLSAHNKNCAMYSNPDNFSLERTLFQRHLWLGLQETFFAPNANVDQLSDEPVYRNPTAASSKSLPSRSLKSQSRPCKPVRWPIQLSLFVSMARTAIIAHSPCLFSSDSGKTIGSGITHAPAPPARSSTFQNYAGRLAQP